VGGDGRQRELAENLRLVRDRLDAACRSAGRDPGEVTLVAVAKTYPAEDVVRLAALGVSDIGENRDQEAAPKAEAVAAAGAKVRWHFVGQLQRNKCRSVVRYADMVQSVDSVRLAVALDEASRREREHPIDVLVQVSIDGDTSRGGAIAGSSTEDIGLDQVLATVEAADGLQLRGLMAVAPLDWEPDRAFAALATIAERVRAGYPDATMLSAGMTSDVEQAIQYGATHVRLGTALLGNRPPLM
jgi:pyridoxal phosphate enzyme (YggS family)